MNYQETAKLLAVMNTVWKDNTESDVHAQTAAYQMALEDVSYQDVNEAVKRCLRELVFFPKPAEILERLPRPVRPLAIQDSARTAPRSAFDLGYLERSADGSSVSKPDLRGVPTLADILAREGKAWVLDSDLEQPKEPVTLPVAIGERKEAVG